MWHEGVEPTNNAAERALRHAVLWRKGSGGTDSQRGAGSWSESSVSGRRVGSRGVASWPIWSSAARHIWRGRRPLPIAKERFQRVRRLNTGYLGKGSSGGSHMSQKQQFGRFPLLVTLDGVTGCRAALCRSLCLPRRQGQESRTGTNKRLVGVAGRQARCARPRI